MGTAPGYVGRHAAVWTIISEDNADRARRGRTGKHVRTDLMTGYKSMGANR